jgi:hypothetical protein
MTRVVASSQSLHQHQLWTRRLRLPPLRLQRLLQLSPFSNNSPPHRLHHHRHKSLLQPLAFLHLHHRHHLLHQHQLRHLQSQLRLDFRRHRLFPQAFR